MSQSQSAQSGNVPLKISLATTFTNFRDQPLEQLRVKVRRFRAGQIRQLVCSPAPLSVEQFQREIWAFETSTLLDGTEVKGTLFGTPSDQEVEEFEKALAEHRLELHGNYVWTPQPIVFGVNLPNADEKERQTLVTSVQQILADVSLSPAEKAGLIDDVQGFGSAYASGLVMLVHPGEFAIYNKQSSEALSKLGVSTVGLDAFQGAMRVLRDRLGAEDFLELDWFLFLVNQGRITLPAMAPGGGTPPVRYWAIALGEGGRLWDQCRAEDVAAIGWDYLGDLRTYGSLDQVATAIQQHEGGSTRRTNDALACYQFCREMRPSDAADSRSAVVTVKLTKRDGIVLGPAQACESVQGEQGLVGRTLIALRQDAEGVESLQNGFAVHIVAHAETHRSF